MGDLEDVCKVLIYTKNPTSISLTVSVTVSTQIEKPAPLSFNLVGCVMDSSPNAPKIFDGALR